MMMHFHVQIQHLIQLESVDAGDCHAQGVANKVTNVMMLQELRPGRQNRTLVGLFHVALKGHQSLLARFVQQIEHHLQRLKVALLTEFGSAKHTTDSSSNALQDVERVCDQHGTDGGAANDDEFGGLHQHTQVPMLHEITRHHAAEDDDDAD